MHKGAAIRPICAYIAAWALIGVHRIIIPEAPMLGWRFVAVRVAAPPVVGLVAQIVASAVKIESCRVLRSCRLTNR